jgi:16S rRNA processing protein RimM
MQLTVARVSKAHGLKGEVALDLRTDDPETRLAVGERLATVSCMWLVTFAEITGRTAAEELRGTELVVEVDASDEEDAWYPHELAGLRVELEDGTVIGKVVSLEYMPAHEALLIEETLPDGGTTRTLVPFVLAIVPVVDVEGGRVVLTPPGGLLARDADAAIVDREDDVDAVDPADDVDAVDREDG